MSQRACLLGAAALAFGFCSAQASGAAENPPLGPVPPRRITLGTTFGVVGVNKFEVDGHRGAGEVDGNDLRGMAGVNVSYTQGLLPYLGAVAVGRCGSEQTVWSEERGEARLRCDFGLGPELFVFPRVRKAVLDMHLAVPVGPTFSWISTHHPLGVAETYSTGVGWNIGAVAGMDAFWGPHGGYLELGYVSQFTTYTHTSTLVSNPSVRSTQHYYFDQSNLFVGAGYAFRF